MSKSRLELRAPPWIILAYFVAPFCGPNAWLGVGLAFDHTAGVNVEDWLVVMAVGGAACLLAELFVVTPILVGFHVYRWPWLNGWTAAAIGFLLAAGAWVFVGYLLPTDDPGPPPDGWQVLGLTLPGWTQALVTRAATTAWSGLIGLVGAVTFRLIAVKPSLLPANLSQL
jgi:hypothetical protein